MNLSPTDIAIRNLIASRMNISNPLILNVLLASTDMAEFEGIRSLIDAMLSGPAGDLTGVLSTVGDDEEECHCRYGRIAAYRTIQGAQLFPIGSPNEDFTDGFNAAVAIIKNLAGQLADELDTDEDGDDGSDDGDDGDDGGDQPVSALEVFGRLFGDHVRSVAASR